MSPFLRVRHIVHFQKVSMYNAVNVLHRRAELGIRSPLEVIEDEDFRLR